MSIASELRLTNADLEAMPEDGNRYEVIDGELFISGPPTYIHQATLENIAFCLHDYLREHSIGEILPGVGVIFDDYTGVIPDLIFISNERRDRHAKRTLYSAHGVTEYWLIDPENQTVELVFDRSLLQTGELTSSLLPGISIRVDTLFV